MSMSTPAPSTKPGQNSQDFALTCSASTLRRATLPVRLRAAAEAGFAGIGLKLDDHRDSGLSEHELKSRLDESVLQILEMEHSWDWAQPTVDSAEGELWRLAEAVGFRQLNVSMFAEHEATRLVDALGRLCDRADAYGVLVALEFLPFAEVRTLPQAWEIVRRVERKNAGIVLDVWHWRRSGATFCDLEAIPPDRITSLQLCDVMATPLPDLRYEARHHRELPGFGAGKDGATAALVAGLMEHGIRCPVSVEIFSDHLDELPPTDAAVAAATSAIDVLTAAGWPTDQAWRTNLR